MCVINIHIFMCTEAPAQERFFSIAPVCYRHAGIVIVGYDVTRSYTLKTADRHIDYLHQN